MAGVCGRQKRWDNFLNILTGKVFLCPVLILLCSVSP
jgi:hypothetical protein